MNILKKAQNALEQKVSSSASNESVLTQSPYWMRSVTWSIIGTTLLGVTWLTFAKTEEIIVSRGKLQPVGSVREIQMPFNGTAQQILVKDGDRVKPNQVLMVIDNEASQQRYDSIKESLTLKEKQLGLKKLELEKFIGYNKDEQETLKEKVRFEKLILDNFKILADAGASSELQYLQQLNTLKNVEGELRRTIINGKRQEAIIGQDIQRMKSDISSLKADFTETQVRIRFQKLRSPVHGVVFDLKPTGPGYTAQSSQTVMKVVPLDALEAKIEIPSSDIGFVRVGMNVDLSIDSFPASDFGVLQGKIVQLGSDALPPDTRKNEIEYKFPATIKLESQELKAKDNNDLPLQPGMSLTANIKLRKVSYLQMLLGSFQDKADSLRRI